MRLLKSIERWVAQKLLESKRLNRVFLQAFLLTRPGRGTLFFKATADHDILFIPDDVIGRQILKSGSFERDSVRDLLAKLEQCHSYKPGMVILEIGANIGTHTIYFFRDLACSKVIAIEPDPDTFAVLKRNMLLNGLSDQVVPICAAISNAEGAADFVRNPTNRGGSHLAVEHRTKRQDDVFSVDVTTIDTLLPRIDVDPSSIDLVWIDVEGHEREVLEGMRNLLTEFRPPIFMEYNPKPDPQHTQRIGDIIFGTYKTVLKYKDGLTPLSRNDFDRVESQIDILLIR